MSGRVRKLAARVGVRRRDAITAAIVVVAMSVGACSKNDGAATELSVGPQPSASPSTAARTTPKTAPKTAPANKCIVKVVAGDSLGAIAKRAKVALAPLSKENSLASGDVIHPGDVLDICVGNAVDDVTGTSSKMPSAAAVSKQQAELNELFASTSMPPLGIDGDSGNYTRQMACAARMGLGLKVHNNHVQPGSKEEKAIFAATALKIPAGAPTAKKWILIDQTCQVIFIGEGTKRVVDVFPTSTGVEGFRTRNAQAFAFRYDPATKTDGWHDSETFPSAADARGNGNMYKPLYFHQGQAIHGARFIPPMPRSHGCARTFPQHQDKIVKWLGLDKVTSAVWSANKINVAVAVRGRFRDRK